MALKGPALPPCFPTPSNSARSEHPHPTRPLTDHPTQTPARRFDKSGNLVGEEGSVGSFIMSSIQRVFGNNFKGDESEPKAWVSTGARPLGLWLRRRVPFWLRLQAPLQSWGSVGQALPSRVYLPQAWCLTAAPKNTAQSSTPRCAQAVGIRQAGCCCSGQPCAVLNPLMLPPWPCIFMHCCADAPHTPRPPPRRRLCLVGAAPQPARSAPGIRAPAALPHRGEKGQGLAWLWFACSGCLCGYDWLVLVAMRSLGPLPAVQGGLGRGAPACSCCNFTRLL